MVSSSSIRRTSAESQFARNGGGAPCGRRSHRPQRYVPLGVTLLSRIWLASDKTVTASGDRASGTGSVVVRGDRVGGLVDLLAGRRGHVVLAGREQGEQRDQDEEAGRAA